MINPRKLRVIGLAVFAVLLVLLLFQGYSSSQTSVNLTGGASTKSVSSNNLVELTNDEKVDAAINNEIGKVANGEEVDPETPDGDKLEKEQAEPFNPSQELLSIRALSPIVIFSKTYCPYSKKLKALLSEHYQITPEPIIVELDKHSHGAEFQKHLGEVSGRNTVPNVLVGLTQRSRGGCEDLVKLHEDGELLDLLKKWGGKGLEVQKIDKPSNV